jgi:hypothetical protein
MARAELDSRWAPPLGASGRKDRRDAKYLDRPTLLAALRTHRSGAFAIRVPTRARGPPRPGSIRRIAASNIVCSGGPLNGRTEPKLAGTAQLMRRARKGLRS